MNRLGERESVQREEPDCANVNEHVLLNSFMAQNPAFCRQSSPPFVYLVIFLILILNASVSASEQSNHFAHQSQYASLLFIIHLIN